jgi:hypothetical protein
MADQTIGVEAVFRIEDFLRKTEAYNKRLAAAEKATEAYAKAASKSTVTGTQTQVRALDSVVKAREREAVAIAQLAEAREREVKSDMAVVDAQIKLNLAKQQTTLAEKRQASATTASTQIRKDRLASLRSAQTEEHAALRKLIQAQAQSVASTHNLASAEYRATTASNALAASIRNAATANQTRTVAEKKAVSAMEEDIKVLRQTRWGIVAVLFYLRMLGAVGKAAWETLNAAYVAHLDRITSKALANAYSEDAGVIVASLKRITNGTLGTSAAVEAAVSGMIATQGQFTDQFEELWVAAEVVALATGDEVSSVFEKLAKAIAEADASAVHTIAPFYDAEDAVGAYAKTIGKAVDELTDAEVRSVLLNTVLDGTQVLLANGVDEALGYARELSELKGSWKSFTEVLFESAGGLEALQGLMDGISARLETASQIAVIFGSIMAGIGAVGEELYARQPLSELERSFTPFSQLVGTLTGAINLFRDEGGKGIGDIFMKAFEGRFTAAAEAMGVFEDSTAGANQQLQQFEDTSKAFSEEGYKSIVEHLLKYEDLVKAHNDKLLEIEEEYNDDLQGAFKDRQEALEDLEEWYSDARADALEDAAKKLAKKQNDVDDDREEELAKHLLRLRQEEEDYYLNRIQSEREYRYQRDLLVARGDVLAIEDLDARYAMEQQAGEEDYRLKVRQMQEDFDLAQQYRKENAKEALQDLRDDLRDQLTEIDEQYQDRLDTLQEKYAEELQEAADSRAKSLKDEAKDFAAQREQWAQHWTAIMDDTQLTTQQIYEILKSYFGDSGTVDAMMSAFMTRRELEASLLKQVVDAANTTAADVAARVSEVMTATQELIRLGQSVTFPGGSMYLPTVGMQSFTPPPPAQTSGQVSVGWQGQAIPISVTNPGTGQTQTINLTDDMMLQMLQAITSSLRLNRGR